MIKGIRSNTILKNYYCSGSALKYFVTNNLNFHQIGTEFSVQNHTNSLDYRSTKINTMVSYRRNSEMVVINATF